MSGRGDPTMREYPVGLLNQRYLVVLVLVAFLVLLNQILVQPPLLQLTTDAPVINIAGRQRMLSQRLAKAALRSAGQRMRSTGGDIAPSWGTCCGSGPSPTTGCGMAIAPCHSPAEIAQRSGRHSTTSSRSSRGCALPSHGSLGTMPTGGLTTLRPTKTSRRSWRTRANTWRGWTGSSDSSKARRGPGSIGPTTSQALRESGLPVDIEPEHPKMGHLVASVAAGWRGIGKAK